jgi:hypothetical protein
MKVQATMQKDVALVIRNRMIFPKSHEEPKQLGDWKWSDYTGCCIIDPFVVLLQSTCKTGRIIG